MEHIAVVKRTFGLADLIRSRMRSPKKSTSPNAARHSMSTKRAAKNSNVAHSISCMYFSNDFDSSAKMISNSAPNNATQAYER